MGEPSAQKELPDCQDAAAPSRPGDIKSGNGSKFGEQSGMIGKGSQRKWCRFIIALSRNGRNNTVTQDALVGLSQKGALSTSEPPVGTVTWPVCSTPPLSSLLLSSQSEMPKYWYSLFSLNLRKVRKVLFTNSIFKCISHLTKILPLYFVSWILLICLL